jgi:IS30 family transposase
MYVNRVVSRKRPLLDLVDRREQDSVLELGGTVITAVAQAFAWLPDTIRKSLTWDRGVEMTRHTEFSDVTGIPVYFCEAYCP